MADERQWVVEPPGRGEVTFRFAVGEGVELSEEQEAALGDLIRSLETPEAEVAGHAALSSTCPDLSCDEVSCGKLKCGRLSGGLTGAGQMSLMGTFSPKVG